MNNEPTGDQIHAAVRERYAGAAKEVLEQKGSASCCSDLSCCTPKPQLYDLKQLEDLPEAAALASLGCGNPTLLAELKPGEVVLDLGSGGGIDVLLSAKRVGPTGKAYGLDMTDEMLDLARANAREAGVSNVEFLKGQIESIPLPGASVDVIISNCVINLSPDKDRVLAEAYRVLKPGGRFAVADIVVQGGPLPAFVRQLMSVWAGCIGGALSEDEYRAKLSGAGFEGVDLEVLKVYGTEDLPDEIRRFIPDGVSLPGGNRIVSAFIRARKGSGAQKTETSRSVPIGRESASVRVKASAASCCGDSAKGGMASCCGDSVKGYFKEIAGQWDQMRESYFTEAVRESAISKANLGQESVVADVGTGTGFMLAGLVPLASKVYGFDNSPQMLEVARKNLRGAENLDLAVSEGQSLPLPDGTLDAAFANMYLHHAPDPAAAVAEMARVLKPGGRLVITDLDKHDHEWMAREMFDVWMGFDRADVEAWFKAAGLADVAVECTGSDCCGSSASGDRATIGVFVASGTKL